MSANLEHQIRQKLVDFVQDEVSLESLHDWLAPAIWDAANGKYDEKTANLLSEIELLVSEYTAEQLTFEELKKALGSLILVAQANQPTGN